MFFSYVFIVLEKRKKNLLKFRKNIFFLFRMLLQIEWCIKHRVDFSRITEVSVETLIRNDITRNFKVP